jgi:hypothetical protein
MAPDARPPIFQRGNRVRLLQTVTFPDVVAEQTLGTVQGHPAHAPDDVVSVAFDGHMLLGGVAVEARLLAPADDMSHVA